MYDPVSVDILTQVLTIFFATVFTVAWLIGATSKEENHRSSLTSYLPDEEDSYAILSGDEEYLAAHVTLKEEPLPQPKVRISNRAMSSRLVLREEPKPKPIRPSKTDFGSQCSSALAGLGCKKSEANKAVDEILSNNPNINDEETFIQEAFKV